MTDEEMRETIRKNLIFCRTEAQLTQTEVGDVIKKSKTAVASWEQGISLPNITDLFKLARYYDRPIEWFYEDHSL